MEKLPDFKKGVEICSYNSDRLAASGRIIINDENGTNSYGLFLIYIAYEEMAKAIFCFFIDKGWVKYEFVKDVFKKHQAKVFLFEEFFASFSLDSGIAYLGGKKLGEIPLDDFIKKYQSDIKLHRDNTMKFLYVEPNQDNWHIPFESITDINEKQEKIESKIIAWHTVLHALQENSNKSILNNFKFYKNNEGNIVIQFDTI